MPPLSQPLPCRLFQLLRHNRQMNNRSLRPRPLDTHTILTYNKNISSSTSRSNDCPEQSTQSARTLQDPPCAEATRPSIRYLVQKEALSISQAADQGRRSASGGHPHRQRLTTVFPLPSRERTKVRGSQSVIQLNDLCGSASGGSAVQTRDASPCATAHRDGPPATSTLNGEESTSLSGRVVSHIRCVSI